MKKEIETLETKVVEIPDEQEALTSQRTDLERSIARECNSVRGDQENLSILIQTKEGELLRFPERRVAISRLAYLMGKIGMQEEASEYEAAVGEMEDGVSSVELELGNLTALYEELSKRARRRDERQSRRLLIRELNHVWALWRAASREEL